MIKISAIRILAVMALLALLFGNVVTQDETRHKELPNFHKVNDALFRGGQPRPGGLQLLRQLGIKTIVNLRGAGSRTREEETGAQRLGLRYFNIPLDNWGRPYEKDIDRVLSTINNPDNQPVFVHCKDGADRTGVVVAVYRISHDGWTGERARAEAKRHGMKPWQFGMKDYIGDFYKRQAVQTKPARQ